MYTDNGLTNPETNIVVFLRLERSWIVGTLLFGKWKCACVFLRPVFVLLIYSFCDWPVSSLSPQKLPNVKRIYGFRILNQKESGS
jgi:hypothetical protein